ncbi:MAG: type IV toxin-antitoxin system AbiEi family antitoxin domain-containing protein [Actinomycetota bacterium]
MRKVSRPRLKALEAIAIGQRGLFTSSQARACGISPALCNYHAGKERFVRIRRGLYRVARLGDDSSLGAVYAAWLALGVDSGFVSHESALHVHGLTDLPPERVHLTVKRDLRKKAPDGVALHTVVRMPPTEQIVKLYGLPVASPARSLVDYAAGGFDQSVLQKAVQGALGRNLCTVTELLFMAQDKPGRVKREIRRAVAGAAPVRAR